MLTLFVVKECFNQFVGGWINQLLQIDVVIWKSMSIFHAAIQLTNVQNGRADQSIYTDSEIRIDAESIEKQ